MVTLEEQLVNDMCLRAANGMPLPDVLRLFGRLSDEARRSGFGIDEPAEMLAAVGPEVAA